MNQLSADSYLQGSLSLDVWISINKKRYLNMKSSNANNGRVCKCFNVIDRSMRHRIQTTLWSWSALVKESSQIFVFGAKRAPVIWPYDETKKNLRGNDTSSNLCSERDYIDRYYICTKGSVSGSVWVCIMCIIEVYTECVRVVNPPGKNVIEPRIFRRAETEGDGRRQEDFS